VVIIFTLLISLNLKESGLVSVLSIPVVRARQNPIKFKRQVQATY
jgi:hypothetical protein